jgi:toxin ParE1/3/4
VEFLDQLGTAYDRIADDPFKYQDLESGIRRALLRRFPYAVYFAVERDVVVILAVLHVSRDPAEWQRRRA